MSDSTDNVVSLRETLAKKYKRVECRHDHLEVYENNRRLTCLDFKREIDPFEAISHLADRTSELQMKWAQMRKDYKNLAGYVPHLRVVRDLEGMWRGKRLPMCPHCKKGVTAEGLSRMGWVHQSYAEAVERHEIETVAAAPVTTLHPEKPASRYSSQSGCGRPPYARRSGSNRAS